MKMKKSFLYCFLLIGPFSLVRSGDEEYEFDFKVVTVDIIIPSESFGKHNTRTYSGHGLYKLAPETKEKLCVDAKKHAALDGFDSDTGSVFHLDHYTIRRSANSIAEQVSEVLLRCETIPRSYLHLGDLADVNSWNLSTGEMVTSDSRVSRSGDESISSSTVTSSITVGSSRADKKEVIAQSPVREITILLRRNKFTREPYALNVVQISAPPEPIKSADPKVLEQAKLYKLYVHDRLDVCVAAKKRVMDATPQLRRTKIEEERTYDFLFAVGRKETLMAIDCSSVPPMYVHFKETIITENGVIKPIDVIWVKPKPSAGLASGSEANRTAVAEPVADVSDGMIIEGETRANGTVRPPRSLSTETESAPMEE